LAVVNRNTPPFTTCTREGEPFVRTWHDGAGFALFTHTLVLVKPPTGKLKDCAATGFPDKNVRIITAANTTAKTHHARPRIIFSMSSWLAEAHEPVPHITSASERSIAELNETPLNWD
jgi:hypothetical protein